MNGTGGLWEMDHQGGLVGFDFHCHIFPPELIEKAKRGQLVEPLFRVSSRDGKLYVESPEYFFYELSPRLYEAEALLSWMDARRIRWAAVSLAPPLLGYWSDHQAAVDYADEVNESIARLCAESPERLFPLATVPMPATEAIAPCLRRAVERLGMRGVEVGTAVRGRRLGDPAWEPLWAAASELGVPVFVHPYHQSTTVGADSSFYLPNLVGMVSDTGLSVAHFIFSGMADSYPELKLIFAHGGGTALWLQGRWDHGYRVRPEARVSCRQRPSTYLGRFFYDSILHSPEVAKTAIGLVGPDRFVLGSDYPFDMGPSDPVGEVMGLGLSPEVTDRILARTALGLIGGAAEGVSDEGPAKARRPG